MINAAIVGLGRWGQMLVNSVQESGVPKGERIGFTRAVARTPGKVADFCAAQKLPVTDDYDAVLADPEIQAVVLATPHSQHIDQINQAAAVGKHVFVEKPITLNVADAKAAVRSCDEAGLVLAVGQNRRFLPLITDLKRMIDAGELGTILHAEGNFSIDHALAYTADYWRANAHESPAGAMTSSGIHIIDSFIHLMGPIATGHTLTRRRVLDVPLDDTAACLVEFQSGATGYLGTMMATPLFFRIHIFGTKGWAQMISKEDLQVSFLGATPKTLSYPETDIERAELEAFALAIEDGTPYPVPLDEVVHGIAVQDALIASGEAGGAPKTVAR